MVYTLPFRRANIPKFLHLKFCNVNKMKRLFSSNEQLWDVVISGGGLVGCAMACALGSSNAFSNKKILLLEETPETKYLINKDRYSNRVSAISPGSRSFFEEINAWEHMKSLRVKDVKKLQVWESCSDAKISFSDPSFLHDTAYIIENNVILSALNSCLQNAKNNVQVMRGVQAINYNLPKPPNLDNDYVTICLKNGTSLKTKLLIGADGVNSAIRKTMGVKYITWKYNQMGIVGTLKLAEPTSNNVAWQRFIPSGPVALLPLTDDLCSLVWTVSEPMARKLLNMTDEEFTDTLNTSLWSEDSKNPLADVVVSRLKIIAGSVCGKQDNIHQLPPSILSVEPESRAAFPLGLGHAVEYVSHRVTLIGDAAHRVHPLAGQGVNLGFGDVQCLSEFLQSSLLNGNDIGNLEPLLDYETQRQRHVVPSMMAIDLLNRLYSTEFTPTVVLRSFGLTLVDSIGILKERIIKHAST